LPISLNSTEAVNPSPVGDPAPLPSQPSQGEKIARSAGITSVAVMASRITGLLRESIMAHLFGAGLENEAFTLGFRIPNLTRDLFAEGALSSAFVPIFTEYLHKKKKEEAVALANLVATALILIVGAICVAGVLLAPFIVGWFAPGFRDTPGKYELAVTMTRIMFPFLLLVALAAQAMGILNACNHFAVPATASTFFNIGSVVFGMLIGIVGGPSLGINRISGMAWGVVLGGGLQLLWQVPSLLKLGFTFQPQIDWTHPGLRRILTLMGPAIIGSAATQINVLVNSNFASHIPGALVWLGCAFRFMQLPIGIFGVAIASATVPSISRSITLGNLDEFRKTLSQSMAMVFLLTVPSSVGLAVLGRSVIGAIYQSGRFTASDTQQSAAALSFYAIGLAGYAALKVITPAYYALNDSRTPMIVSFLSIAINFVVAGSMTQVAGLGHAGLALSTSSVALAGFIILFTLLRRRIQGIYGRALVKAVGQVSLASAIMGCVVWLTSRYIESRLGLTRPAHLVNLAFSVPTGVATYYSICRLLGVAELDLAVRSIAGPLSRRFKR
jgi:putative peptidoglycan lipid II flippase